MIPKDSLESKLLLYDISKITIMLFVLLLLVDIEIHALYGNLRNAPVMTSVCIKMILMNFKYTLE